MPANIFMNVVNVKQGLNQKKAIAVCFAAMAQKSVHLYNWENTVAHKSL